MFYLQYTAVKTLKLFFSDESSHFGASKGLRFVSPSRFADITKQPPDLQGDCEEDEYCKYCEEDEYCGTENCPDHNLGTRAAKAGKSAHYLFTRGPRKIEKILEGRGEEN